MTVDDIREEWKKSLKDNEIDVVIWQGLDFDFFNDDYVEWLEQQLLEARKESYDKSCCGNCDKDQNLECPKLYDGYDSDVICEHWEFDRLTREEREV